MSVRLSRAISEVGAYSAGSLAVPEIRADLHQVLTLVQQLSVVADQMAARLDREIRTGAVRMEDCSDPADAGRQVSRHLGKAGTEMMSATRSMDAAYGWLHSMAAAEPERRMTATAAVVKMRERVGES